MDKIKLKFQEWDKEDKQAFKDFILDKISVYNYIWVVGSRVIGGFRDNSDLDIMVFVNYSPDKTEEDLYYDGIRVSIHYRHRAPVNIAYNKFYLSYYDLLTDTFHHGPDDEKYKEWRENQYL